MWWLGVNFENSIEPKLNRPTQSKHLTTRFKLNQALKNLAILLLTLIYYK